MNDSEVKTGKSKLKYLIPLVIIYMITAALMFKAEFGWADTGYDVDLSKMTVKVSSEDFRKISIGMTYREVCRLLGGKGAVCRKSGSVTDGLTYYTWPGELNDEKVMSSYVTIAFNNESGRAEMIREVNILDGQKVRENKISKKAAVIDKSESEVRNAVTEGMTYKDAVSALGSEGVLTYSDSVIDVYTGRTISRKYRWECRFDNGISGQSITVDFSDDKAEFIY